MNTQWNTTAAKAVSKGVELEAATRIFDSLKCSLGFGCTDIESVDYSDAQGSYKGKKKPYAPEYFFHLALQYRHATGFFAQRDVMGYGEIFVDRMNVHSRDAYQLFGAKLGCETANFDVYLYGKNIFDEEYDVSMGMVTLYSESVVGNMRSGTRFVDNGRM